MHRLSSSFILGYHGCDRDVGERILAGDPFEPSNNPYDWLGPGIYFWEANPLRGLEFAAEQSRRGLSSVRRPFVIGAIIDLGMCLDLTNSGGIEWIRLAYQSLVSVSQESGLKLPENHHDGLRRNLDCAVISHLHHMLEQKGAEPADTVKGIFTEGSPVYPGAGIYEKTHVQIAVRNLACIKGVFRVSDPQLKAPVT